MRILLALGLVGVLGGCGGSDDSPVPSGGGASSGNAGGGASATPTSPPPPPGPGGTSSGSDGAAKAQDIVFFETPAITHTKDFFSYADYVNPSLPSDWTSPVDYANGTFTFTLEIVKVDPRALPFYYAVGWEAGDGSGAYLRGAIHATEVKTYVGQGPVKGLQKVIDGHDSGAIGDGWDWTRAFKAPNGDTWNADGSLYPVTVKAKMVLHPAKK